MKRFFNWLRDRRQREWFVIGDLSPFRGPMMLISGPHTWPQAKREADWWVEAHPCGKAAVTKATAEVAALPRYILDDYK